MRWAITTPFAQIEGRAQTLIKAVQSGDGTIPLLACMQERCGYDRGGTPPIPLRDWEFGAH